MILFFIPEGAGGEDHAARPRGCCAGSSPAPVPVLAACADHAGEWLTLSPCVLVFIYPLCRQQNDTNRTPRRSPREQGSGSELFGVQGVHPLASECVGAHILCLQLQKKILFYIPRRVCRFFTRDIKKPLSVQRCAARAAVLYIALCSQMHSRGRRSCRAVALGLGVAAAVCSGTGAHRVRLPAPMPPCGGSLFTVVYILHN